MNPKISHISEAGKFWIPLEEKVRQRLFKKVKYCEYCKREIKRNKFSIYWKLPPKYQKSSHVPARVFHNLKNVCCVHPSCANRTIAQIFKI